MEFSPRVTRAMDVIGNYSRRIESLVGKTASILLPATLVLVYLSMLMGAILGYALGMEATSVAEFSSIHTEALNEVSTDVATGFEGLSIVGVVLTAIVYSLFTISLAFAFGTASIMAHIAYYIPITIPVVVLEIIGYIGLIPAIVYIAWRLVTAFDAIHNSIKSYRHSAA